MLDRQALAIALSFVLLPRGMSQALSQQYPPFSVSDDIAIARIADMAVSPNEELIVVHTDQASLDDGLLHDKFWIYSLKSIHDFVGGLGGSRQVEPVWSFELATKDAGGNSDRVSRIKWLSDSSGFAFLLQVDRNHHRLQLATVVNKEVVPLSADGDNVLGFDIRDRSHYAFTIASREAEARLKNDSEAPYRVGTGSSLDQLAFPEIASHIIQRGDLWAATGGQPAPVIDRSAGEPISLFSDGNDSLGLSPDGNTVVTIRAVSDIPEDWVDRFPPPYPDSAYRLRAHQQDLTVPADGWSYVGEWVSIALSNGRATPLTDAPESHRSGWWEVNTISPKWSKDGSSIVLPGTFRKEESGPTTRPCILVVQVRSGTSECVRPLKRQLADGYEPGWESVEDIEFVHGSNDTISTRHVNYDDASGDTTTTYDRSETGHWSVVEKKKSRELHDGLAIRIDQSFMEPPILVASDPASNRSAVILDPNPQLKRIAFGDAEPYGWHDKTGREWKGILYKPLGYTPNATYPLVIQNHGFSINRIVPRGGFPSAFVAQELASVGIMVLQVQDCAGRSTPLEGPCNVEGYEGAVDQLAKEGLIDSSRVGIIGFSRTVYYVLEALTTSRLHFKAASITDGVTFGYMGYLLSVGPNSTFLNDQIATIGSQPFGPGLTEWVKSSPVFNLDKVTAPLRVVAFGTDSAMYMWEPYALLEAMHKPVDLIVLNTREHVLVDPAMRLVAQGGNVDWFRFWLQGYVDPDPAKREQYSRWQKLRDGMPGREVQAER